MLLQQRRRCSVRALTRTRGNAITAHPPRISPPNSTPEVAQNALEAFRSDQEIECGIDYFRIGLEFRKFTGSLQQLIVEIDRDFGHFRPAYPGNLIPEAYDLRSFGEFFDERLAQAFLKLGRELAF